ncbi:hypothetical protein CEXT_787651 [Caerostris extrusa]|uniref:Uncharacterized protein n=1 Tax=Caerostris extrusa TaxID=172846 RepID=A0AAV4NTL4_CAEEX|nr:hypothetical protein CEXT_787651 [Caerostris extrusa]
MQLQRVKHGQHLIRPLRCIINCAYETIVTLLLNAPSIVNLFQLHERASSISGAVSFAVLLRTHKRIHGIHTLIITKLNPINAAPFLHQKGRDCKAVPSRSAQPAFDSAIVLNY